MMARVVVANFFMVVFLIGHTGRAVAETNVQPVLQAIADRGDVKIARGMFNLFLQN